MNQVDSADSERIVEAITGILPVLEEFYKFEGPDEAALRCAEWKAKLDVDLPEKGEGLNSYLARLQSLIWTAKLTISLHIHTVLSDRYTVQ